MNKPKFNIGDRVRIVRNTGFMSIKDKYIGQIMTIGRNDLGLTYPYAFEPDIGWAWAEADLELVQTEKIVITNDGKTTKATLYRDGEKFVATARCAPEDKFDFTVGAELAMKRLIEFVNPVNVDGFKVGDRVHYSKFNGTVICIPDDPDGNCIGIEFDDVPNNPGLHSCRGILLKAGTTGKSERCLWCYTKELEHGEYTPKYYNGKVVCIDHNGHNERNYTIGKIYQFVDGKLITDTGYPLNHGGEGFESFDSWTKFSSSKWIEIKE